jgi:N-acetylmuramoyl-L-alanine amidase
MIFNHPCKLYGHSRAVRTVVIDPGHGGRAPGAIGRNNMEKDIALAISLKLGELIKQYIPDVNVVFTRKTDIDVGLQQRADIANRNNADLFISIHCNGAGNRSANGSETFVMGYDKSQSNLAVAMKENADIYYEEDYEDIYGDFDPNKPETHIIFSLFQHQYLNQSLKMASLIQDQFRERSRRVDRGVKQGPFWVLHKTAMPAVLVEVGFITNEEEEKFMASNEGQNMLASAIFRAFRDYKNYQDKSAANTIPQEPLVYQQPSEPLPSANTVSEAASQTKSEVVKEEDNTQKKETITPEEIVEEKQSKPEEPVYKESPINQTTSVVIDNKPNVVFKVQFLSTGKLLKSNSPEFKGLRNVDNYHYLGMYRYTVGNEPDFDSATNLQRTIRTQGFRDAFVVAFINGERATIQDAQKLLNQ